MKSGSEGETYNTVLTNLKTHLMNYRDHIAAGIKGRDSAANEAGCIADCYIQAVKAAENLKIPQPEKQVLHNFYIFFQGLGFAPEDIQLIKKDMMEILHEAGAKVELDFEKKYGDALDVCEELVGVLGEMFGAKEASKKFLDLIKRNFMLLHKVKKAFEEKIKYPQCRINSQMLADFVISLKAMARNEEFWTAFDDVAISRIKQEHLYQEDDQSLVKNKQDMIRLINNSIDIFNYFYLESSVLAGDGHH